LWKICRGLEISPGRIEATLSGRTLSGWWYQNNGKGRFVFNFSEKFDSFTGKWGYNDAEPTGQWNGKKKSPLPSSSSTGQSSTTQGGGDEQSLIGYLLLFVYADNYNQDH
jgi:hypothetical protein